MTGILGRPQEAFSDFISKQVCARDAIPEMDSNFSREFSEGPAPSEFFTPEFSTKLASARVAGSVFRLNSAV